MKANAKGTTIFPKSWGIQGENIIKSVKYEKCTACHKVLPRRNAVIATLRRENRAKGLNSHRSQLCPTPGCCEKRDMNRSRQPTSPCARSSITSHGHSMRLSHLSTATSARQRARKQRAAGKGCNGKGRISPPLRLGRTSQVYATRGLLSLLSCLMTALAAYRIMYSGANMALLAVSMVSTSAPSKRSLPSCAHWFLEAYWRSICLNVCSGMVSGYTTCPATLYSIASLTLVVQLLNRNFYLYLLFSMRHPAMSSASSPAASSGMRLSTCSVTEEPRSLYSSRK